MPTDDAIVKMLTEDNEQALSDILIAYGDEVRAYLLTHNLCTQPDDEDVLADAVFFLWQRRNEIDLSKGTLRCFLYGVARLTAKEMRRRVGQDGRHLPLDSADDVASPSPADLDLNLIVESEAEQILKEHLGILTEDERAIVYESVRGDPRSWATDAAGYFGRTANAMRQFVLRFKRRVYLALRRTGE